MESVLADLWNGNISPVVSCGNGNPEINELVRLMGRHLEKLNRTLSKKQLEIVEKYTACAEEYLTSMVEQAFCDGFGLCSKILTEALVGR